MIHQDVRSAATPEAIAAIWRELLGHDEFNHDESFFDVGGHSLVANKLFGEIQNRFGVNLPVVTIFEFPTINELVLRVNEAK